MTFYIFRYPEEKREEMLKLIKEKYHNLLSDPSEFDIPQSFPKYLLNKDVMNTIKYIDVTFQSQKHVLLIGKGKSSLSQISHWVTEYYSSSEDDKKKNHSFICTPKTTISDLIGRMVKDPRNESGNDLIWKDGPLIKSIKNGICIHFDSLLDCPNIDKLIGFFDQNIMDGDTKFDISENTIENIIEINTNFKLIATCSYAKLDSVSPALLNRFNLIYLDGENQNEVVSLIFNNELDKSIEFDVPSDIIPKLVEECNIFKYTISNATARIMQYCDGLDSTSIINFVRNLLELKYQDFYIPEKLKNNLLLHYKNDDHLDNEDLFNCEGLEAFKDLFIKAMACSIIRKPIYLNGAFSNRSQKRSSYPYQLFEDFDLFKSKYKNILVYLYELQINKDDSKFSLKNFFYKMLQIEFGDLDQLLFHIADTLCQMDTPQLVHKTGNLAILLEILSQLYEKIKFEKINNSIKKSKLYDSTLLKNEITTHGSSQINLLKLIIEEDLLIDYTPICFYSTSAQNVIIEISNLLIDLNFEKMISIVSKVLNTPYLFYDAPTLLNCDIIQQSKFSNVLKLLPLFIKLQEYQIPFSINNKEFRSILCENDYFIEFSISDNKFEITENSKILYKSEPIKIDPSKFYSAVHYLSDCVRNKKTPEFEKEFSSINYPIIPTNNHPLFGLFPSEIKSKILILLKTALLLEYPVQNNLSSLFGKFEVELIKLFNTIWNIMILDQYDIAEKIIKIFIQIENKSPNLFTIMKYDLETIKKMKFDMKSIDDEVNFAIQFLTDFEKSNPFKELMKNTKNTIFRDLINKMIYELTKKCNNHDDKYKEVLVESLKNVVKDVSSIYFKNSIIMAVLSTMTNSLSYDIVYMMDSTGSMGSYLRALEEQCINISNELKNKLPNYDFQFGAIFYRDPIDSPGDKHEKFLLSSDVESLRKKIRTISPYGGADGPEDWVGAYQIALNQMNWREGVRLIIHIADAPAHGHSYCGFNNHEEENDKLAPLLKRCCSSGIKIVGMPIGEYNGQIYPKQSYERAEIDYNSASSTEKFYKIHFSFASEKFYKTPSSSLSQYFKDSITTAALNAIQKTSLNSIPKSSISTIPNSSLSAIPKSLLNVIPKSSLFDIVYMIDATGSMCSYIKVAEEQCINISNELKNNFPSVSFQFGAIFYRDPIDSSEDKHETFLLSADVDSFKNQISKVSADGGGDGPEDWVGAYQIALNQMNWREGVRLIIHIADAPAHGHSYCGYNNHEEENDKLAPLLKRCCSSGIKIVGMPIDEYCCRKSFEQTEIDYNSASNSEKFYNIQPFKS